MNEALNKYGYKFAQEAPITDLNSFKDHQRLGMFFHKGTTCAHPGCNRVGTRLIKCDQIKGKGSHWDVYTDDLHLMTVDHIQPRSKGGSELLSNKQPMCREHNTKKGSTVPVTKVKVAA
jgi:hypothetical protein